VTWDAMVQDAETQLRTDHGLTQAHHETQAWENNRHRFSVSFTQGHRTAWWQAVKWLLNAQEQWGTLPPDMQDQERAKGPGSIFHPIFKEQT
jgi:hypothetical protein